jgi:chitodextrinase
VAPVLTNPGAQSGTVGVAVTALQLAATDGNNDPLTFSATGLPAGLTISASGQITGTPTAAGANSVTVTVNDGRGGTDSATFSWTIAAANVAPVLTNPGAQSGTVGVAVTALQLAATDGNNDPLTFSATGLPAGLTISASGQITGTPTAAGASVTAAGANSVTVTVNDGRGGTDSATFSWTIAAPPDTLPPSVPSGLTVTSTTTTSISLSWIASSDTGGSGLAGYRIYRDGANSPLAIVAGTTFTDAGLTSGSSHSYRVSAYDTAGNESAASNQVTATALDTQAPSTPAGLQASNVTTTSARLSWQASTDAGGSGLAGYRLFRDGVLVATVSGTSFTDTGLSRGRRYRYTVASVDGAGNQSVMSASVTVNTKRR